MNSDTEKSFLFNRELKGCFISSTIRDRLPYKKKGILGKIEEKKISKSKDLKKFSFKKRVLEKFKCKNQIFFSSLKNVFFIGVVKLVSIRSFQFRKT
ncbi:hypothetical protein BpHYR1_050265 [Brachionus plicatilis]|uniref:Uncharacterized protein n=1 Tax=Brachionus plicatilis TaxID=10195 RepID=A0A3M7RVF7_BRAPC|nr:hypothetical protein BpHYR1_050265 [Brachionus plicatilis]